jgi:hypothetical protein
LEQTEPLMRRFAATAEISKKDKLAGKTAQQALIQQLTKDRLALATENIGHPERVTVFVNQTRLI